MDTLTLILFLIGLVFLVVGAESLVRGASKLALALGISPLVIGLTVVSIGTSAPEVAVGVSSALAGKADLTLGNVVGSNIFNVLFVLGLCSVLVPLVVAHQLIQWDVPLMIGVSCLPLAMGWDGRLGRWDGLLLFLGAVGYILFALVQSRHTSQEVIEEYEQEFGGEEREAERTWPFHVAYIVAGLVLLVTGSQWLVSGAVALAKAFGISELVIGLTVVAIGTSLPEIAASIVASLRGERDIAVGNVVGSNLSNILLVLGLSAFIAPEGVRVSRAALTFDLPVMIAVAAACLPIFFRGHVIARWEGALFLGYYLVYTLYLYLDATRHAARENLTEVMLIYVIPLTIVTVLVLAFRYRQSLQSASQPAD
ncbi:MAG: calcium/sodium antiporter [Armatimonadetes bacterium]|nr:calcium/sodium antiporter [Armatimonadota bacterium]